MGWGPSLAHDGRDDRSRRCVIPVLAKPQALPSAKRHLTPRNRDLQAAAEHARFAVRRHIVISLRRVRPRRSSPFWDNAAKKGFHVVPNARIAILVDGEAARRVLHEEVEHADIHILQQRPDLVCDIPRNEVATATPRRKANDLLLPNGGCRRRHGVG